MAAPDERGMAAAGRAAEPVAKGDAITSPFSLLRPANAAFLPIC